MKYGDTTYICEVFEDDEYFATVEADTLSECLDEASYYELKCDGAVTRRYYERREILSLN